MSEKIKEITEGSFLRVNEEGKAYWGGNLRAEAALMTFI